LIVLIPGTYLFLFVYGWSIPALWDDLSAGTSPDIEEVVRDGITVFAHAVWLTTTRLLLHLRTSVVVRVVWLFVLGWVPLAHLFLSGSYSHVSALMLVPTLLTLHWLVLYRYVRWPGVGWSSALARASAERKLLFSSGLLHVIRTVVLVAAFIPFWMLYGIYIDACRIEQCTTTQTRVVALFIAVTLALHVAFHYTTGRVLLFPRSTSFRAIWLLSLACLPYMHYRLSVGWEWMLFGLFVTPMVVLIQWVTVLRRTPNLPSSSSGESPSY
jgi:hypothetical protein